MAQPGAEAEVSGQVVIETRRTVLRGARPSDAEDLYECFHNDDVMRYWDTLPHADIATTQKWVDKMVQGENNGVFDFVIGLKPVVVLGGAPPQPTTTTTTTASRVKIIGKVGIWHDSEIGFLLHRRYWGQGLALEVLRAVLDLAFDLPDTTTTTVTRQESGPVSAPVPIIVSNSDVVNPNAAMLDVVADVDPRNGASLGILKKLGFEVYATKQKTFSVGGEWVDSVYLSLKRDTWIRRREEIDQAARTAMKSLNSL